MGGREIVPRLKRGDIKALEQLMDSYGRYVYSVLARILRGRSCDCEELTQDVFVAVWNNRSELREGNLKAYLGAIARNRAFNFLRSAKEELPLEEDLLFSGEDPMEAAEQADTAALLNEALQQFEPKQRELFVRHYYYGETVKEAAEEMKLNFSTAKTWLSRGREKLKETLEKGGYSL